MPSSGSSSGRSSKGLLRGIEATSAEADDRTGVSPTAAKGKLMTADQLKRKLRNFPAAKLTRIAALAA